MIRKMVEGMTKIQKATESISGNKKLIGAKLHEDEIIDMAGDVKDLQKESKQNDVSGFSKIMKVYPYVERDKKSKRQAEDDRVNEFGSAPTKSSRVGSSVGHVNEFNTLTKSSRNVTQGKLQMVLQSSHRGSIGQKRPHDETRSKLSTNNFSVHCICYLKFAHRFR